MVRKTPVITPPETNIAPENGWLEYYILHFWDDLFSGAMLVSGRVSIMAQSMWSCSPKSCHVVMAAMAFGCFCLFSLLCSSHIRPGF